MNLTKCIPEIEKLIKYTFKDKSLLIQSFTRSSYCNERNGKDDSEYMSNEVLEFFGDSVLSTAIITLLMDKKTERYKRGIRTSLTEGDFSNIRSKLSDKKNLSKSTAALGLQKYLLVGEGDKKLGIENEPSVMEDLFESIIGAIYIDCGRNISTVTRVVAGILDISLYYDTNVAPIQSFKNALQEFCADKKRRLPAPVYKTLSENGPDHRKTYERACLIGDVIYGVGTGKNIKLADAAAAEAALVKLQKEEFAASPVPTASITKLKEYAHKSKLASPEFRDLGETDSSTENDREYIIECRLLGTTATGIGKSKQEARARAADKLLTEICGKAKLKKDESPANKKSDKANILSGSKIKPSKKAAHKITLGSVSKSIPQEPEQRTKAPAAKAVHKKIDKKLNKINSKVKRPALHKKHL